MTCPIVLRRTMATVALLLALTSPASHLQAQGTTLQGVASVIDGDTLEIRSQRIRLFGIDAPESGQSCTDADGQSYRCGQRASLALSDRIGRSPVTCHQHDTDRYGRVVAVCMLGNLDLNGWMVREGHALAYRKYSTAYMAGESVARHEQRGLWAGDFMAPWDWRKDVRNKPKTQDREAPDKKGAVGTCNIKGNISRRSGDRIYHMPGQNHYARTRISPGKGERWFCSEAEARAAGWRRARQ